MICPLMSRPLAYRTVGGETAGSDMHEAKCVGSRCAFWRFNRNAYGDKLPEGRCGYADGEGGESFQDPAGQWEAEK